MAFSDQNFPKGMSANLKSSKQNISSPGTNMKTFRSKMFRRGRLIPLLAPLDNTDCMIRHLFQFAILTPEKIRELFITDKRFF